jgi:hypothetical protein
MTGARDYSLDIGTTKGTWGNEEHQANQNLEHSLPGSNRHMAGYGNLDNRQRIYFSPHNAHERSP